MSLPISNYPTSGSNVQFNKSFSQPGFSKPVGGGTGAAGNTQGLQAYLEEAMAELVAVQNGQAPIPPEYPDAQAYMNQLVEWITWTQQQLGAGSSWDPMASSPYGNNSNSYGGPVQNSNGFLTSPNGTTYANWQDVKYTYSTGDAVDSYVWTNNLEVNVPNYGVDVKVSLAVDPKTGEPMLLITLTDKTTGTVKNIYVQDYENTTIQINTVDPEKTITVDPNAEAAGAVITTGEYKAKSSSEVQGTPPDETLENGELVYKQPNTTIGNLGGQTAYVYSTIEVTLQTDPMDKITSVTNDQMPNGEAAIKITIEHADGTIDTIFIRKVNGLDINFASTVSSQFNPPLTPEMVAELQKINGIPNQFDIIWAGAEIETQNQKIIELAEITGIPVEELYTDESYSDLVNLILANDFSKETLTQAFNLAEDEKVDMKLFDVLNNTTLVTMIKESNGDTADVISKVWRAKALAKKLDIDFEDILKSPIIMQALTHNTKLTILLNEGVDLLEKMDATGDIEALEAFCDEDILEWIDDPKTSEPPKELIEFLATYDDELSDFDSSDLKELDDRLEFAERVAKLLNSVQDDYEYKPQYDGGDEKIYLEVWENDTYTGEDIKILDPDGDISVDSGDYE
ncbi:MAG: hypothetical protein HYU97_03540 [Deltaproteobacteria bacterium]|nr:hypothetical protein [Deltaproteobacteria bacterium]